MQTIFYLTSQLSDKEKYDDLAAVMSEGNENLFKMGPLPPQPAQREFHQTATVPL